MKIYKNVSCYKKLLLNFQLERLQAENAQEWGKRERLETEKLALERENKKIHNEMESLQEELDKKGKMASALLDSDLKILQQDVAERTKVCIQGSNSFGINFFFFFFFFFLVLILTR